MISLGARIDNIAAAVGPCIARASYEVGHDFAERLLAEDPDNERFLVEGQGGMPHFDLEAYVAARLAAAGIGRIETVGTRYLCIGGPVLQLSPLHSSHRT